MDSLSAEWPGLTRSLRSCRGFPMRFLLDPHPGLFDHVLPERDFFRDLIAELLVAAAGGGDAVGLELRRGLLDLEDLVDLAVDALDHRARQVLRADEAVPQEHVEALHARLGDRRHL